MPVPSHDLKIIVAAPFHRDRFRRLAALQHMMQSWGWEYICKLNTKFALTFKRDLPNTLRRATATQPAATR